MAFTLQQFTMSCLSLTFVHLLNVSFYHLCVFQHNLLLLM